MRVLGIIAEYNPFHSGHAFQIAESRRLLNKNLPCIAVMSGCWVQQADCALTDKWSRAHLALMGGVDLVLELPTVWAAASAEAFARGAVSLLNSTGIVNILSFGSECGNLEPLQKLALCLDGPEYRSNLPVFLNQGLSFPDARRRAVLQSGCKDADLLAFPNNNLGVEYLRALSAMNSTITPMTILRRGAFHNSSDEVFSDQPFASASQIRAALRSGKWDKSMPYLLPCTCDILSQNHRGLSLFARIEPAIMAKIRTMTAEHWSYLPDSGKAEGLPDRLVRAGQHAVSLEDFLSLAKTKRYTHSRIRRLVLWAYLGLTAEDIPSAPPYLRVLGFTPRGQMLLRMMKDTASIPILTKPAHAKLLDGPARRLFELESRCTDLYDLCLETTPAPRRDWTTGPVLVPSSECEVER